MDAAIDFLLETVGKKLVTGVNGVLDFHKQYSRLSKELEFIMSNLKDVDMLLIQDKRDVVKKIDQDLRELLYSIENIVDDCERLLSKRKGEHEWLNFFSPHFLYTRCQMTMRIQERLQEVSDIVSRVQRLGPLPKHESNPTASYPVLLDDAKIVGMDDDAKKMEQWIMARNCPFRVVGIVGMGGIGKSTLAQKIRNDHRVQEYFFYRVLFVTVSRNFKFEESLKYVLRKLNARTDSTHMSPDDVLREIKNELSAKRYLVILDDVWGIDEQSWWNSFKSALPQHGPGGSVIVTTRNKDVALQMGANEKHIHYPEFLRDEHCWSIFANEAFPNEVDWYQDSKIQEIGKEIVSKCGGLPLAIKAVGGMMLGKGNSVAEWERIAKYLREEFPKQQKGKEFQSALQLSYDELPSHLKPCMLGFAAYPEDYVVSSYEVIHWWIGEGFVQDGYGKTAYEIGEEYFNELISRSLLLGVIKDVYERRYNTCRVHDMMREVIIEIAKECSFIGVDDRRTLSILDKSRRVGIADNTNMDHLNETSTEFLRTVTGRYESESEERFAETFGSKLHLLKRLKVLDISFRRMTQSRYALPVVRKPWLENIKLLPHLMCIQIVMSGMETLPDSIGKLQNLQILSLTDCPHLTKLPFQVTLLKKLTILELNACASIENFPAGLGNLSNLQSLLGFKPAASNVKGGCHTSELKKLTKLRRLDVVINSESQVEEGWMEVLSELNELKILLIRFEGNINGQLTKKVNSNIKPLQSLQDLRLQGFPGEMTPTWLNPGTLPDLRFLNIDGGNIKCIDENFYGKIGENNKLWKLEVLLLSFLYNLEAHWPEMNQAMPLLRQLKVVGCPKLKSPPYNAVNGGGAWRKEKMIDEGPSDPHIREQNQSEGLNRSQE